MRSVERMEGLALSGDATVGGLRVRTPSVLDAAAAPDEPLGPTLASGSGAAGVRQLHLGSGPQRLEVAFPVLTPEVTPAGTGVFATSSPTVAYVHAPAHPDALARLRERPPELIVLGNARTLWNEGEPLTLAVRALRDVVGPEPLLWAPRVALPHRIPLLVYLGVDLVDTTEGLLEASAGRYFDLTLGTRDPPGIDGGACDCSGCRDRPSPELTEHVRALYRRALLETRAALAGGVLRELVEARLAAEPAAAEHLRYADRHLAGLLEERCAVTARRARTYVLAESQRRPEMARFRDRLVERYRPPPSKSILLLVPCSKTKPYRLSPSHRRFARALEGLHGLERVHLVSVSSPLGLVPRELEDVPPARHYDIPVTGDWSTPEQEYVTRALDHLVRSGSYRAVVLHLDRSEYAFVGEALGRGLETVSTVEDGRTTSAVALDRLRGEVGRLLASVGTPPLPPFSVVKEELTEVVAWQLGRDAAQRFAAPPFRVLGRPWFLRFTDGRNDLGSLREERGLLQLTVSGALRLGETVARVDADPALSLQGDLFAPGVVDAAPGIRAGDTVGVFQDGVLAAVGEAALSGRLMRDLAHGVAVRIRHRAHRAVDSEKAEVPSPTA